MKLQENKEKTKELEEAALEFVKKQYEGKTVPIGKLAEFAQDYVQKRMGRYHYLKFSFSVVDKPQTKLNKKRVKKMIKRYKEVLDYLLETKTNSPIR